jgi:hypothetical protein
MASSEREVKKGFERHASCGTLLALLLHDAKPRPPIGNRDHNIVILTEEKGSLRFESS